MKSALVCFGVIGAANGLLQGSWSVRGASKQRARAKKAATTMAAVEHSVILQNKGGGHGEIGYHLAKELASRGHKVTLLQDSSAKREKLPFSRYESDLVAPGLASVEWLDNIGDTAAVTAACAAGGPVTHVWDNWCKSVDNLDAVIPLAGGGDGGGDFSSWVYVSSAGMYTGKGMLSEDGAVKDPATGQREVEMALQARLGRRWTAFRPQYIYGPFTNKRDYLDWFLHRAARSLPMEIPGDGTQPVCVTHAEDVALLLASTLDKPAAAGGAIFNCGTDAAVSYTAIAAAAAAATSGAAPAITPLPAGTKSKFPFRPNAEGFCVSVAKATEALEWAPRHSVLSDMAGFYTSDFNAAGLGEGALPE